MWDSQSQTVIEQKQKADRANRPIPKPVANGDFSEAAKKLGLHRRGARPVGVAR